MMIVTTQYNPTIEKYAEIADNDSPDINANIDVNICYSLYSYQNAISSY